MIKRVLEVQQKAWSVALRSVTLPVTSLFSRSERDLSWRLSELCSASLYPQAAFTDLIDDETTVTLSSLPSKFFNVTELDLLALAALTAFLKPGVSFEIGTADGRTTLNLAMNSASTAHVYTLNLPPAEQDPLYSDTSVGSRFHGHPAASQITQLWGDSASFDFDPYRGKCELVACNSEIVRMPVHIAPRAQ